MSSEANYSTFRASHIYKKQKYFVVVTDGLTLIDAHKTSYNYHTFSDLFHV